MCYNEAIRRYNEVSLFPNYFSYILYHYWGKGNRSLHRGLSFIEVRYIEVPLYMYIESWAFIARLYDGWSRDE